MTEKMLQCCLYFTANSLARVMTTLAEDEFKKTGMSPNYAFILMLACQRPGVTQKEISEYLHLTPSTITRFVDKLENNGLVVRRVEGKMVLLEPTTAGQEILPEVQASWERLYHKYSTVLGCEAGVELTRLIGSAVMKLENK